MVKCLCLSSPLDQQLLKDYNIIFWKYHTHVTSPQTILNIGPNSNKKPKRIEELTNNSQIYVEQKRPKNKQGTTKEKYQDFSVLLAQI